MANSRSSDTELLRLMASHNDQRAFNTIFDHYWDELYHLAIMKSKCPDLAQDLTQEVFINLWKYRKTIQVKSTFSAYLATMLKYGFFKHLAKQGKESTKGDFLEEPYHEEHGFSIMEFNELYHKISKITTSLPPRCKAIFEMSSFQQMSVEEIATNFKISTSTVRNQLARAREVFREQLTEDVTLIVLLAIFFH
ncbi:sigma-70 family RNA polymerase sigma factor [Echinicola soli]|uniref:Sigma-70 family RNA polymerase sigma factor n=1 Tax=Echinicola soli TaxID=2591634 RepID=A0A514CMB4_9BACT|nr:sigma-70 family RNA polymerase sigma factor [Echinicola soli]QDH80972.1 sigma-70 family RNA polymerase sigma factor [Echinicola soli]